MDTPKIDPEQRLKELTDKVVWNCVVENDQIGKYQYPSTKAERQLKIQSTNSIEFLSIDHGIDSIRSRLYEGFKEFRQLLIGPLDEKINEVVETNTKQEDIELFGSQDEIAAKIKEYMKKIGLIEN